MRCVVIRLLLLAVVEYLQYQNQRGPCFRHHALLQSSKSHSNDIVIIWCTFMKNRSMPGKPPDLWGPRMWFYLHGFARIHDATQDARIKHQQATLLLRFMDLLQWTMPCGKCRDSFKAFWRNMRQLMYIAVHQPPALNDWATSVVMYNLHNMVSIKLNKPYLPAFETTLLDPLPTDDNSSALWEYLFVMAYNLNNNSEVNKLDRYREFIQVLCDLVGCMGMNDTHLILRRHVRQITTSMTQEEWVSNLYWAYHTSTSQPLSEDDVYQTYGVCDPGRFSRRFIHK